jgi:tRNA pseudouridine13 synthase
MAEGRFRDGAALLPPYQDVERIVALRLDRSPTEYVEAMRGISISLRRLYTQAYQSYIFNRTLSLALQRELDISRVEKGDNWGEVSDDRLRLKKAHGVREAMLDGAVPLVQLVGYAYRNYGSRFDRCVEDVLQSEGVSARDFYVKEMQEVSVEGGFRRPHMTVMDSSYSVNSESAIMEFTLARGEYATVLIREALKPADPALAGFD